MDKNWCRVFVRNMEVRGVELRDCTVFMGIFRENSCNYGGLREELLGFLCQQKAFFNISLKKKEESHYLILT